MLKNKILVTGANGEIGHSLIASLANRNDSCIVALDLQRLDESLSFYCYQAIVGDILDTTLLHNLAEEFDFDVIYHMAALLSTSAERQPEKAHLINVQGTINLLHMATTQGQRQGRMVKFLFPSSIAVYGMPNRETKAKVGKCKEGEWCEPITMYGVNKLYCEHLGRYYAHFYRQLDLEKKFGGIDFRCLRFPGLISAITVPTGGTSDYLPEMLHHAAQGMPYACFVSEDTRLPFMIMPDAVKALLTLEDAPRQSISRLNYNVTSFNPCSLEFYDSIRTTFPDAELTFKPDLKRQGIVDSWPADLDDSAARRDWGWYPDYDLQRALEEYLIPTITQRYGKKVQL